MKITLIILKILEGILDGIMFITSVIRTILMLPFIILYVFFIYLYAGKLPKVQIDKKKELTVEEILINPKYKPVDRFGRTR